MRAVVEIVVPERVHAEAAGIRRLHELHALRLVLGDDERRAAGCRLTHAARDFLEHMRGRGVEHLLRGVQAQAIDVELVHPVARVGDEEFAHRTALLAVEVDRLAPLVAVAVAEVALRELFQVVAVGAHVVVDHVEDHREPRGMRAIHEAPEIVGLPVEARRGEKVDAVVAPAESPGKLRHRHDLDDGDAGGGELRQLARGRLPASFSRKRPHVHLVEDLSREARAAPCAVAPPESRRIHDSGRSVRSLRLEARGRIGKGAGAIEAVAIERARSGRGNEQ